VNYADAPKRPGRKRLQSVPGKRPRKVDMQVLVMLQSILDGAPKTAKTILQRNGESRGSINFDHHWRKVISMPE